MHQTYGFYSLDVTTQFLVALKGLDPMPASAAARHFTKMARTPNLLISLSFLVFVSSKPLFF